MPSVLTSVKRFAGSLVVFVVVAAMTVCFYQMYVAKFISEMDLLNRTTTVALILTFFALFLLFIRSYRRLVEPYIGAQATTILNMFLVSVASIVTVLAALNTFGVSAQALLTGAGFASITIGLIISTFVGGILAGALVFATHKIRLGDTVIVNNMPGTVTEISALVTRITTDTGYITIPNSAISSGGVVITRVHKVNNTFQSRLPYKEGDRVITTYMGGEGTVKELTALRTTILLDSGREIVLLNSSVLSGAVAVAKISPQTQTKNRSNK